MQTCTVCRHKKVQEINLKIIKRVPLRDIGRQYGLGWRSVGKHKLNCLPRLLEKAYDKEASTTRRDVEKNAKRMDKIIDAAEEWLRDPNNPEGYSFAPRTEDIEIVYLEQVGEQSIKKKDMLQAVLSRLDGMHVLNVTVRRKSPVEAFIQAARVFRDYAETIMRVSGELVDTAKVEMVFRLDPMEKPEGAGK